MRACLASLALLAGGCTCALDTSGFVRRADAAGVDAARLDATAPTDAGPGSDSGRTDGGASDAGPQPVLEPASQLAYYRDLSSGSNHMIAWFLRESSDATACTELAHEEACTALQCDGPRPPTLAAGMVSVVFEGTALLETGPGGVVYQLVRPGAEPPVGADVELVAAGGASVPAFRRAVPRGAAPSLWFPARMTHGAATTLSWNRALAADHVEIELVSQAGTGVRVRCRTTASSGTLRLPPDVFVQLPRGGLIVFVRGYRRAEAVAGELTVELRSGTMELHDGITLE